MRAISLGECYHGNKSRKNEKRGFIGGHREREGCLLAVPGSVFMYLLYIYFFSQSNISKNKYDILAEKNRLFTFEKHIFMQINTNKGWSQPDFVTLFQNQNLNQG